MAAQEPESKYKVALDHAYRAWQAEEENARRHAGRMGLLLTAIVAFGGVGLFRFAQAVTQAAFELRWPLLVVAVCLFGGVALLGAAALYLTGVVGNATRQQEEVALEAVLAGAATGMSEEAPVAVRHLQASLFLRFPPQVIQGLEEPLEGTEAYYCFQAFLAADTASAVLSVQNHFEKKRILAAQKLLWWAMVAFFVGILIYTGAGVYNQGGNAGKASYSDSGAQNASEARRSVEAGEADEADAPEAGGSLEGGRSGPLRELRPPERGQEQPGGPASGRR